MSLFRRSFLAAQTSERTDLKSSILPYTTDGTSFIQARLGLALDPDVGRRNEILKWNRKLTVRERLISAAR